MNAWTIRKFLLKHPRAAIIRLTIPGGATQEIKCGKTNNWNKVSETIAAVAPELIELLNPDGMLLRAMRPDIDDESSIDQPRPPKGVESDPETLRLNHMASLLAKAYEHATNIAFGKLVDLVERLDARQEATEARLERMESAYRRTVMQQLNDAREEALEAAESAGEQAAQGSFGDELMRAVLSGAMRGNVERPSAPTNGKGKA